MSTRPNYPTRDAPYITPATVEAAQEWPLLTRLRELCLCSESGGEKCLYCESREQIEAQARTLALAQTEISSWKAVAHDHSERLKVLTVERGRMLVMLRKLASECADCGGTGTKSVTYGGDGYGDRCAAQADAEVDCEDCKDVRDAIGEAS